MTKQRLQELANDQAFRDMVKKAIKEQKAKHVQEQVSYKELLRSAKDAFGAADTRMKPAFNGASSLPGDLMYARQEVLKAFRALRAVADNEAAPQPVRNRAGQAVEQLKTVISKMEDAERNANDAYKNTEQAWSGFNKVEALLKGTR